MAVATPAHGRPEISLSRPVVAASPWIILIVLALGEYMILLDTTIVNVAIPNLASDLGVTLDQVLWVINAYVVTFAVLLIPCGRIGDMIGPKKLFLAGLLLFTLSSLLCGLSQSGAELIAFRVTQGIGAALLTPQAMSIITSIFPPEKRGAAFGIWGALNGLGAATGPSLGGLLTTTFSWRATFFVNVPIGCIAIVMAFLVMPELNSRRRHHLDVVGVVLASGGLFLGTYGLVEGDRYQWGRISNIASFTVGPIQAGLISIPSLFLLAIILLVAFVVWEARQAEPLLPISLLGDFNFSAGTVIASVTAMCMIGLLLPFMIFLQSVRDLSALRAGITVLPFALAAMVGSPVSGKLSDKINGKFLTALGLVLLGAGIGALSFSLSLTASTLTFIGPLVLVGLGMGLTFAPMVSLTMRNVAPSAAGAASGFQNTIRHFGAALGGAVVGAILQSRLAAEQKSLALQRASELPASVQSTFAAAFSKSSSGGLDIGRSQVATSVAGNIPAAIAHQIQALSIGVFQQGFLNAMRAAYFFPIAVAVLGSALALTMKGVKGAAGQMAAHGVPAGPPEGRPPVGEAAAAMAAGGPPPAPVSAGFEVPRSFFPAISPGDTMMMPVAVGATAVSRPAGQALEPPYVTARDKDDHLYLKGRFRIGRQPGNDLVVDDPQVSRRHAEILRTDGGFVVRDLASANGTLVNGRRITGDQPLRDGDVVSVGGMAITFHHALDRARPRLVTVMGPQPNREYALTGTITVGRLPGNTIVTADGDVSRHHAEIYMSGDTPIIHDLASLNGTRVNGQFVPGEQALQNGDTISIGNLLLVFQMGPDAVGPLQETRAMQVRDVR